MSEMNGNQQDQMVAGARTACTASQRLKFHCSRSLLLAIALGCLTAGANAQTIPDIDLRKVYEQARDYDAEYQAAAYALETALQAEPQAKSAFKPQLTVSGEIGLRNESDDVQGTGAYEYNRLSLNLEQTIFNRARSKTVDQARIATQQAQAQYAAVGQTLILRVATAYFDVLRAQADVEFSQSELQAISRQREQAERRFDVGLVPITDVRSAQAQYDLAVAQEIAASNQLFTAREALLRISGVDAELLTPLAADLPLSPPEPADIDAWVALAKEQNLELVIARLANESNSTQVAIERASRYPTIGLSGTVSRNGSDAIDFSTGSKRGSSDGGTVALEFTLPLYTGGKINADVAQAKASLRESQQQTIIQERTTTQQTRDAFRGVKASISRVRALRQALASTEKSAEATEAGFRAGTRTSVEVLQALRDTYSAQSDYAGARYDFIINTLNLKAASGALVEGDIYAINRFLATSNR